MSQQAALSFMSKANSDAALMQEVNALEGNLNGLIALAAKAGFDFSADDWTGTMADLQSRASRELSESDLDQVAGGAAPSVSPTAVEFSGPLSAFQWGVGFCVTGEH